MESKSRECVWAPGTLDADVTYAGEHTRAAIARSSETGSGESGTGWKGPVALLMIAAVAAALWFIL